MEKNICYLIAAHADPEHLSRLVIALNEKADFVIHIDSKVDIRPFQQSLQLENVYWIEGRVNIAWAGITQVEATLRMMRAAMTRTDYLKLVFISGACYPIKSNDYIYRKLALDQDHEHIRYFDMLESSDHYRNQIFHKWFKEPFYEGKNKYLKKLDKATRYGLNKLKLKNEWDPAIVPYFGSNWWALTPQCCRYILEYVKNHPEYYKMNARTFSVDEHFFHTIIGNSSFAIHSDGMQVFTGRGTYKLANLHLIHQSLSKWYSINDLEEIINSDKLFVRKLNSALSKELISKLNQLNNFSSTS